MKKPRSSRRVACGSFTVTFLVLAGFGSLVFAGALLFPHRPEELEALPARLQPAE